MSKFADVPSTTYMGYDLGRAAVRSSGVLWETYSRLEATGSNVTLTSAKESLILTYIPAGLVLTGIAFLTTGTGLTNPTIQYFTLRNGTTDALLKQTTDDTTTAWGSNTRKALSWSGGGSYTIPSSGLYKVGIAFVVGSGSPTFAGLGLGTVVGNTQPYLAYNTADTISTGTAVSTAGAFNATLTGRVYAELLG